jgi:hypothetical protein
MCTIIGTNKKQNVERDSFLLQVRYVAADAKVTLQRYITENPLLVKTLNSKLQVVMQMNLHLFQRLIKISLFQFHSSH